MEIILIVLTSTLIGAFIFASYQLGIKHGKELQAKDERKNVVEINKANQRTAKGYTKFTEFQG